MAENRKNNLQSQLRQLQYPAATGPSHKKTKIQDIIHKSFCKLQWCNRIKEWPKATHKDNLLNSGCVTDVRGHYNTCTPLPYWRQSKNCCHIQSLATARAIFSSNLEKGTVKRGRVQEKASKNKCIQQGPHILRLSVCLCSLCIIFKLTNK